jgi:hypothetical protein
MRRRRTIRKSEQAKGLSASVHPGDERQERDTPADPGQRVEGELPDAVVGDVLRQLGHGPLQLAFYALAGICWGIPLFPLISWMNRGR